MGVERTVRNITAVINKPLAVAKGYCGSMTIEPTSKTTSVAVISLKNSNVQRGKDFINKLLEMYNINTNNDKNEVAQKLQNLSMNVLVLSPKNWVVRKRTWKVSNVGQVLRI